MILTRTSWSLGLLCCVALLASCSADDRKRFGQSDSAVEAAPDAAAPPLPVPPAVIPSASSDAGSGANPLPPDSVPPATELDASTQAPPVMDAGPRTPTLDATPAPRPMFDATLPSACALDAASAACCTEDPAKCAHPLRGSYAVRTVSYARQKTSVSGVEIDVVNKGVMLSVADVSGTGIVTEHLCAIELINEDGLYSWTSPTATERIGDSVAPLELRDGVFVRSLANDQVAVAWSQAKQPADCTPGAKHASGCTCAENDGLPTKPDDCRVSDLDEDGLPGLRLSVGVERPADPNAGAALFSLQVAAVKSVEWRIKAGAMEPLVGQIAGSIEQSQLSIAGDGAADIGKIRNANCPDALGHVELVRGNFDCKMLLAGRTTDPEGLELFDVALDGQPPKIEACPDPDPACALDSDGDGTADCRDACAQDKSKTVPGACGCGVAETNSDSDALPDCTDACPTDTSKVAAGVCGCGVADTNTDGDALPDCTDACPADASKVAVGSCGCGVADTNTDGDAQPDCADGCPADPSKLAAGSCGCGVADADSDADGTLDCLDACPADASKTAAGTCGCGVADRDLNGDGSVDCTDLCPSDPVKVAPGLCGCGVADTNADGDAQPDCSDSCPADASKVAAGSCGCGVADTNADGDAQPDCSDGCPADPGKLAAGICGCGVADADSDSDGALDCLDACPADASKTAAGTCGCGVPDRDLNGDGSIDCTDLCPADPAKVAPGLCGCGVADTNTDGDARPDCSDACPADASKVAAGSCGCGVAETNRDGDAQPDCSDGCPTDPAKVAAGTCGCGVADTDSDSDGTLDCRDACPSDATKSAAGICGCGIADRDLNGDGSVDCSDLCPADPAKVAPGLCGCGVADTNRDGDALPDCTDACPSDPAKTVAGQCGCGAPESDGDGDGSPNCVDQCPSDPTRTLPGACGCQECAANPLVGTFAVRSSMYAKQRIGTDPATTSKAYSYALVTIASNADGSLTLSERGCWSQTVPNPSEGGLAVYSWVKPAWSAAFPPTVRTLRPSAGGSFSGGVSNHSVGWDAARQPSSCSATSTPPAGWASSWGSTCRCSAGAGSLPPYDRDTAPYDCRLTDPDADGYPGASAFVSTSAPATPNSEAGGLLGARAFAASLVTDRWTLTPGTGARQWGTIADTSTSAIVGCTGGACAALGATSPSGGACPEALNKVQLVPVTGSSDTCDEIIAQRDSLFVTTEDGPWPSASACPVP